MTKSAEDILKTAILLEHRGKAFYTIAARETQSEAVRKFFTMIADWERTHFHMLHRIDEDLKEQIWQDDHFWPF